MAAFLKKDCIKKNTTKNHRAFHKEKNLLSDFYERNGGKPDLISRY
jgi:hypothetical protein